MNVGAVASTGTSMAAYALGGLAVAGGIAAAAGGGGSSGGSGDTKAPTATITMDDTALKAGDTSTVTITFSEAVSGFANEDLIVANGTLTDVASTNGGVTWTATFTPTTDLESTTNAITLANTYTDVSGNTGTTATSANYAVDTKAPTATITMDDTALKANKTSVVTITFNEVVSDFAIGDLTAQGGALSNLVQDGTDAKKWTATFTPTTDLESTTNAITLANTYTDVAGNTGTTATSANYAVDTKAPTLTIVDDEPMATANMDGSNTDGSTDANGGDILYTFTFDEAVIGFDINDIGILHGSTLTFTPNSSTEYTLSVRPEAGYEGDMTISVDNATYSDAAGNNGSSDVPSTQAVDMKAPVFTNAQTNSSDESITLTYDEVLDAVNIAGKENFSVEINGIQYLNGAQILNVGGIDTRVTLTLEGIDILAGDKVRVSYSDSTTDIIPAIQDLAGNDATSFAGWYDATVI